MVVWGVDLVLVEQYINSYWGIYNFIGDYCWQLDKIKVDLCEKFVIYQLEEEYENLLKVFFERMDYL